MKRDSQDGNLLAEAHLKGWPLNRCGDDVFVYIIVRHCHRMSCCCWKSMLYSILSCCIACFLLVPATSLSEWQTVAETTMYEKWWNVLSASAADFCLLVDAKVGRRVYQPRPRAAARRVLRVRCRQTNVYATWCVMSAWCCRPMFLCNLWRWPQLYISTAQALRRQLCGWLGRWFFVKVISHDLLKTWVSNFACKYHTMRGRYPCGGRSTRVIFSLFFVCFTEKYAKFIFCKDTDSHAVPVYNLAAVLKTQWRDEWSP